MKVGIITFHWGTNYGGVLQAYALQSFLESIGHEVSIINYNPKTMQDSLLLCFKSRKFQNIKRNIELYRKEQNFIPFRKMYLNMTERYFTLEELQLNAPKLDVYVAGSDQIWNPYIIKSYGKPYFLNFGQINVKRISYAPSFGCQEYPKEELKILSSELKRFDSISYREDTGKDILVSAGYSNSTWMPDPTLLLPKKEYQKSCTPIGHKKAFSFFYILQENQILINSLVEQVKNNGELDVISNTFKAFNKLSIEDWLGYIKEAEYVVTNSFHGVVFSIIFQKPFVVVPIEGRLKGMNDRIITLLSKFDLLNRLLVDEDKLNKVLNETIDWESTIEILNKYKELAKKYFDENSN